MSIVGDECMADLGTCLLMIVLAQEASNKVFEVLVPHFKASYRRHREGFHDERTRKHQPTAMSNRGINGELRGQAIEFKRRHFNPHEPSVAEKQWVRVERGLG